MREQDRRYRFRKTRTFAVALATIALGGFAVAAAGSASAQETDYGQYYGYYAQNQCDYDRSHMTQPPGMILTCEKEAPGVVRLVQYPQSESFQHILTHAFTSGSADGARN